MPQTALGTGEAIKGGQEAGQPPGLAAAGKDTGAGESQAHRAGWSRLPSRAALEVGKVKMQRQPGWGSTTLRQPHSHWGRTSQHIPQQPGCGQRPGPWLPIPSWFLSKAPPSAGALTQAAKAGLGSVIIFIQIFEQWDID